MFSLWFMIVMAIVSLSMSVCVLPHTVKTHNLFLSFNNYLTKTPLRIKPGKRLFVNVRNSELQPELVPQLKPTTDESPPRRYGTVIQLHDCRRNISGGPHSARFEDGLLCSHSGLQ